MTRAPGLSGRWSSLWRNPGSAGRDLDAVLLPLHRATDADSGVQHRAGGGDGRSAAIAATICRNSVRGTITSAIWKAIERPWRMTLAPILTSRSRSVVNDQCLTASGSARVRRKLARLYLRIGVIDAPVCNRLINKFNA